MAQWYYTVNGQQAGPVDDAQMRAMIQNGQVQPTDLIWKDGMAAWAEARSVPELTGGAAPAAPVQPTYQQPGYATPAGYASPYNMGPPPKNWLVEAIILAVCCCPIPGIVGIIFAAQVNSKWQIGDRDGALRSANTAKQWVIWGFVVGFILNVLGGAAQIWLETQK